jgi:excisionase family DNA binding protein
MKDDERLLTPREAAKILGVGASTLYRMAAHRMIPTYQIGRTGRRVVLSEVLAALRRPAVGHDAR